MGMSVFAKLRSLPEHGSNVVQQFRICLVKRSSITFFWITIVALETKQPQQQMRSALQLRCPDAKHALIVLKIRTEPKVVLKETDIPFIGNQFPSYRRAKALGSIISKPRAHDSAQDI